MSPLLFEGLLLATQLCVPLRCGHIERWPVRESEEGRLSKWGLVQPLTIVSLVVVSGSPAPGRQNPQIFPATRTMRNPKKRRYYAIQNRYQQGH